MDNLNVILHDFDIGLFGNTENDILCTLDCRESLWSFCVYTALKSSQVNLICSNSHKYYRDDYFFTTGRTQYKGNSTYSKRKELHFIVAKIDQRRNEGKKKVLNTVNCVKFGTPK